MDLSILPKLAGLLLPLAGIALPLVVVYLVLQHRERQRAQLYDTVKHLADRGLPVPRELLDPPPPTQRFATPRWIAFTLIGTGAGIALMFASMDLASLSGIGGLLVCIGVAQLIAQRLDAADLARAALRE